MRARHLRQRQQFEREVAELFQRLGARVVGQQPWQVFEVQTRAGLLRLTPHTSLSYAHEPWFRGGGSPWIAGRFDDVKAAVALLGSDEVNPYSGKWNHLYWAGWTSSFTPGLRLLEGKIRRIQDVGLSCAQQAV